MRTRSDLEPMGRPSALPAEHEDAVYFDVQAKTGPCDANLAQPVAVTFRRVISKIAKWVAQKAAYRAGIRDEVRNKPLRQYRDPSLQIAYMFGRVEVREDH